MSKIFFISFLFVLLVACSKNQKTTIQKKSFEDNLFEKINYYIDSTNCHGGFERMFQIRHQKYEGKDFIQINSVYDYYPDSLYYCITYKNNFIAIYNKNYFEKKITYNQQKKDSLLKVYKNYDLKYSEGMISEKRCFEIFEINNKTFTLIPHNSFYYNNLFGDSLIPPAPLPALKK